MEKIQDAVSLTCCCCGSDAGRWKQHWNRDTGYGICASCVAEEMTRCTTEQIESYYGNAGINFAKPMVLNTIASSEPFKVGDIVTWVNSQSVKYPERRIVGIDEHYGDSTRYYIEPNTAPWISVPEKNLIHDKDDPVLNVVNLHKIRSVLFQSETWFMVGVTNSIYSTIDAARQAALQL